MTDGAPILTLTAAGKTYQGKSVLEVDDFTLHEGQRLAIWGLNGCGKSTLLRVLANISHLSRGQRIEARPLHSQRVAYLPQSGGLYDDLTIDENQRVLHRLYGVTQTVQNTAVLSPEMLADLRGKHLADLSVGQRRVAALWLLLSISPDILFLDEPFAGLDPTHHDRVRNALNGAVELETTIVLTAHKAGEAGVGWREVEMQHGRLA